MSVSIAGISFSDVDYDAESDVLYLSVERPDPAWVSTATPEGHAVFLDEEGDIKAITLVNARWLLDREDSLAITLPRVMVDRRDLQLAFSGQA